MVSRRTSRRRRSLAGGRSDCQMRFKPVSSRARYSMWLFSRETEQTDRRADEYNLPRSVRRLAFHCGITKLEVLTEHQGTFVAPDQLDFCLVLMRGHQSSPVRSTTSPLRQIHRRCPNLCFNQRPSLIQKRRSVM